MAVISAFIGAKGLGFNLLLALNPNKVNNIIGGMATNVQSINSYS